MLSYKPEPYSDFTCPKCGNHDSSLEETVFLGKYTLAYCSCHTCDLNFYHTYPVGHSALFPVSFSSDKKYVSYSAKASWWALPLLKAFFGKKTINPDIEIKQYQKYEAVVLLICLDDCFGHSFTMLLNSRHLLKKKDLGVVVVIQKSFQWLLPEGIAEAWLVDASTKALRHTIGNLDSFINTETKRFDKVLIHDTYMPPDFFSMDYEKFTQTKRFNLDVFDQLPPVITFVCREDRTWTQSPLQNFLYLFCTRYRIFPFVRGFFAAKQNKLFSKVARLIKKELPNVTFYATGFGTSGGLSPLINDLRTHGAPDEETERNWCSIYSRSHLAIGVHGSNMLIPTALAAGFINILPSYKISNFGEDISINYRNNYLLFLSRHLDQYTPPTLVAKHAIYMITKFKEQLI